MPPISWILFRERVVGRNSPAYNDVDNRPLRQLVELHGFDPDALDFPGLHHFPLGLYTDDIFEEVAGSGVHIHNNTTIDGDVAFTGGQFVFTASATFRVNLASHQFSIDGGDIHLTNGRFFGDLDTVTIKANFTVDSAVVFTINSIMHVNNEVDFGANAKLKLTSTALPPGPFPFSFQEIEGVPWLSLDKTTPGAEIVETFGGPGGWRIRKNNGSNSWMEITGADDILHFYFTGGLDFSGVAETGWSAGTGGTMKGGLVAGTSTLTDTQKVVNSLVSVLLTHYKLVQP